MFFQSIDNSDKVVLRGVRTYRSIVHFHRALFLFFSSILTRPIGYDITMMEVAVRRIQQLFFRRQMIKNCTDQWAQENDKKCPCAYHKKHSNINKNITHNKLF
jgi:hypothetical protein